MHKTRKALFFNTEQSMSEHFLLELVTSYQNNPEALSSQLQDIPYQKITESGSTVQKLSASRKSRFISPSRFFSDHDENLRLFKPELRAERCAAIKLVSATPFGSGRTFLLREIAAVPIDTKSRHHFVVVESLR